MSYQTSSATVATAGQTQFDVNFPYLDRTHVAVSVNSAQLAASAYTWISDTRIQLKRATAGGDAVVIARKTPIDQALVTFNNGAVLTKEELNTAVLQVLYIQQELTDQYSSTLDAAKVRLGDNLGIVTDPQSVIDELVQMVLADQLLADLNQRLADLDLQANTLIAEILRGNDVKQGLTVLNNVVTEVQTASETTATVVNLLADIEPDGEAVVLREDKIKRADGTFLAQSFSDLEAQVGTARSYADTLVSAITGPTGSLTELQQSLGAYATDGSGGFILNDLSVRAASGTVMANFFTGLQAQVGANTAGLVTTNTALTTGLAAQASSISALSATVGGYSASITSLQSVQTGLGAKWGVALDVNGHISGLVQNNDGATASFTVVAEQFAIVTPGQGTVVPFSVVGGYANFANPVTVFKAGSSYKLVMGPGFGAASDLVLWFGPSSIGITACTRGNALMCLCTDGTIVVPSSGAAAFTVVSDAYAISGNAFPSGSVTTANIHLTPRNAVGTVSYSWQRLPGATGNIAVSGSTAQNPAFTGSVASGGQTEGAFLCTCTDSASPPNVFQLTVFAGIYSTA